MPFIPQNPPHGDPQMPPPYYFKRVGIRMFPLEARANKLQDICDRYLNDIAVADGLAFRVEPLVDVGNRSVVLLEILNYPKMGSKAPGHENHGFATQNELLFAIPVIARDSSSGPFTIGLFVPYIYVDNDWSLISGRDVIGYPKIHGVFNLPQSLTDIAPASVDTLAIETYGPNNPLEPRTLVEINAMEAMAAAAATPEADKEKLRSFWPFGPSDDLYGPGGPFELPDERFRLVMARAGRRVRSFTLKQFRDAENNTNACYQAIVSFDMSIDRFHGAGALSTQNMAIKLHEYDSVRIADQMGIVPPTDLDPFFPVWFEADFDLVDARNEHVRCAETRKPERRDDWGKGDGGDGSPDERDRVDECLESLEELCVSGLRCYTRLAKGWIEVLERLGPRE